MHDFHDRFFKAAFGDPATTSAHLASSLDPAVSSRIDWANLRRLPTESADQVLAIRRGDLHFEAPISTAAGESAAHVWLHLEHQSRPDPRMAMRVFVAMGRAWEQWERANGASGHAYPVILPIVIYNGRPRWRRRTLASLCGIGESLAARVIDDVGYVVQDVRDYADRPTSDRAVRVARSALHAGTREEVDVVSTLRAAVLDAAERPSEPRDLHTFGAAVQYLVGVRNDIDKRTLDSLTFGLEPTYREMAMTYGERLIEEGLERAHRDAARRMRDHGVSAEDAAAFLGVTPERIAELLEPKDEPKAQPGR